MTLLRLVVYDKFYIEEAILFDPSIGESGEYKRDHLSKINENIDVVQTSPFNNCWLCIYIKFKICAFSGSLFIVSAIFLAARILQQVYNEIVVMKSLNDDQKSEIVEKIAVSFRTLCCVEIRVSE